MRQSSPPASDHSNTSISELGVTMSTKSGTIGVPAKLMLQQIAKKSA
jgi:hypothetical protein